MIELLAWCANAFGVAVLGALTLAVFALFVLVLVTTWGRW